MVSVAMAFYNGKTYIEEQIDSILRNLKEKDAGHFVVVEHDRKK